MPGRGILGTDLYISPIGVKQGTLRAMPAKLSTKKSIYFRSLGCPKNQLDSEVMLGKLALDGFAIAEEIEDAQVAIVNTCSFIESAREESIEAILEVADLRATGALEALVVTGCLPQRYGRDLAKELPEVDAFVGTNQFQKISSILRETLAGQSRGSYIEGGPSFLYDADTPRLLIGPQHSTYVKLSEGCDRVCAFCAIPSFRGPFHSRGTESILQEVKQLAAAGTKEINFIAQDSTAYGKDLPGRPKLADLLRLVDEVEEPVWLRQLYLYPTAVSDELIDVFAGAKRLLPYVDIPMQHASDRVLKAMKRGVTAAHQRKLIRRLRDIIPGLTLRTTVIVGFPGETEEDFQELCEFVRESDFDRLGAFRYSDEEGTTALDLPDKVDRAVSLDRFQRLMSLQQELMQEKLQKLVGSEQEILIDQNQGNRSQGRMASQAPEIDGLVKLLAAAHPGERVQVRITGVNDVDLEAEPLRPSSALPVLQ
jgi:ribosomal protein S12 methylthiotransferase